MMGARADGEECERVEKALRDLTGNLLRIMLGGGRPHNVLVQVTHLLEAAQSYQSHKQKLGLHLGADDLNSMISLKHVEPNNPRRAWSYTDTERDIIRAAFRIAAAWLTSSTLHDVQESRGRHEFAEALRSLKNGQGGTEPKVL